MKTVVPLFNRLRLLFIGAALMVATVANAQTNVYDDVIATSPNHTILKTVIDNLNLQSTLQNPNADFTIFAPDDAAFNNLATALGTNINGLLMLPNLTDIVNYHVLGNEILSSAISNGDIESPLSMSNTLKLTVTSGGSVFVNQAEVNAADLTVDNGTVHSLDAVLLPDETVVDVAIDNNFSTLVTAVVTAELVPALSDPFADYTVFAPDNNAFNELATDLNTTVSGLLQLPNLADILTYHVLHTQVPSSGITNGAIVSPLSTTNDLKLTLTGSGDVFVNHAQVTLADVPASNGIVHVISEVVLPIETVADVAIDNNFTTLVTAVVTAELLPALTDPFAELTVFAPDNLAFDDVVDDLGISINDLLALPNLADILTYHVLGSEVMSGMINNGDVVNALSTTNTLKLTVTSNSEVFINHAEVMMADIGADNGVVHTLDAVLLPNETVADIAIDNNFTTLVTALATAELLPVVTDPFEELTVFAPDNSAFDDLATELNTDINGLLALPNLDDILLYHVLDEEVASADINNGDIATTVSGTNTLKLTVTGAGDVFANHAQVSGVDFTADNGIVHILDDVVLPNETVVDAAIDNNFTALTAAVVTAELVPALTNPFEEYTVFAPTDMAFNNLASDLGTDLNGLLALPTLGDILLYHVVDGTFLSGSLTNGNVTTLNSADVTISVGTSVMVNDATVVTPDVTVDNGVVHAIDKVLDPTVSTGELDALSVPELNIFPNPSSDFITISNLENIGYEVMDAKGSVVKQGFMVSANQPIDISDLNSGTYILRVQEGEAFGSAPFVKK